MFDDTIAAISTGMSQSGINVIRISGPESIVLVEPLFSGKNNKKLTKVKSHTLHYGHFIFQDEKIDEVLVSVMKAPNTYTKEDVIEINCHGGQMVTRKILGILLNNGIRIAEPGEFTKRAFLNGRLDLSQAEAVMDIINAQTELSLKSSVDQLNGHLKIQIESLRNDLIETLAHIEASIDYPEYDIEELENDHVINALATINFQIKQLIDSSNEGRIIKEGIKTVIIGKPNVGKSSLLNALIKESRAIVTDIPGTTRDVLEEYLNLKGIPIKMMDTAGIRETDDVVEKIGVERSLIEVEKADLVIMVLDQSREIDEEDFSILNLINDKRVIIILNKADLKRRFEKELINKYMVNVPIIETSMVNRLGINELEEKIKEMFLVGDITFNDHVYITNVRHKNALIKAYESVSKSIDTIKNGYPEDFWSIDIKNAYSQLGEIIGETIEEDLMHTIFSRFCLGK